MNVFSTAQVKEIGVGTIVGSAVYNISLAMAIIAFLVPRPVRVYAGPVLRDSAVYLISLGVLLLVRRNREVTLVEASLMLALYVFFLFIVFTTSRWVSGPEKLTRGASEFLGVNPRADEGDGAARGNGGGGGDEVDEAAARRRAEERAPILAPESEVDGDGDAGKGDQPPAQHHLIDSDEEEEEESGGGGCSGCCKRFFRVASLPFRFLYRYTVPDYRHGWFFGWSSATFCVSLLYVFLISYALLATVERLDCVAGIDEGVSGLTLLAWGASLPDTIAMGVTAHRGLGGMAFAGLIGSNIFDILVGLGVPWLAYIAATGENIELKNEAIMRSMLFLVVAIVACVVSLWAHRWMLQPSVGVGPFVVYIASLVWALLL